MSDRLLRGLSIIGAPECYDSLVRNGIDTWDRLVVTTEEELDSLDLSPEHQQQILRGVAIAQLSHKQHDASSQLSPETGNSTSPIRGQDLGEIKPNRDGKRRYRRHPKRDPNAPRVPPTAYVVFSNQFREKLPEGTSFSEIAKEAGKAWQALHEEERTALKEAAGIAQARYREEMRQYKETEDYKKYIDYLDHFKTEEQGRLLERSTQAAEEGSVGSIQGHTANSESAGVANESRGRRLTRRDLSSTRNQSAGDVLRELIGVMPFNEDESRQLRQLLHDALSRQSGDRQPKITGGLNDPTKSLADKVWDVLSAGSSAGPTGPFNDLVHRKNNSTFAYAEPHLQEINPFHMQPEAKVSPFIHSFLDRVNHVFFFFDDEELLHNFRLAYDGATEHSSQVMCEVCLALSIGIQWSDDGHDDSAVMWYENGRRFLDSTHWDHEAWVMRVMALISVYHLASRPDTAQHYLHIGIRIARANKFYPALYKMDELEESHETQTWTRVWNSITVLHSWLELAPSSAAFTLAIEDVDPELFSQENLEPLSDNATQTNMYELSFLLRAFAADVVKAETVNVGKIEQHLKTLQSWSARVPESMELSSPNQHRMGGDQGWMVSLMERSKSAKLHLVSTRLGAAILLTSRILLEAIEDVDKQRETLPDERIVNLARVCVQSAYQLTMFYNQALNDGFLPPASWITVRFVFDASMVGILTRVWRVRLENTGRLNMWRSYNIPDDTWLTIINSAQNTLLHCAFRNQSAGLYLENLRQLQRLVA